MRKFLGLMLAALLGGVVALSGYMAFNGKSANKEAAKTNEPVKTLVSNVPGGGAGNLDFTEAAKKTVDAVVHVKIRSQLSAYENPFYNFLFGKPNYPADQTPIVAAGSGVIISSDGYIVTNNHVIEGADILEVTLDDQRTFKAKVIGSDPTTDIALIKIDGDNFPFLRWGDSDDLKVGEWVLAVGNPFNLASTVTAGIVSAKARSINIINKSTAIEAFIQTDAAVNPGNSGGALVNTHGELVGINTAIASPTGTFSGYSFAVPERIARKIVSDLLEYGSVQRAFIGVSINEVTSDEAKKNGVKGTEGVYVVSVTDGGAAQDAGIKAGDVILKIGSIPVNRMSELQEQVGQYRPGDQLNVTVRRGEKEKELLLTLRNINGNTEVTKGDEQIELLGAAMKVVSPADASKLRISGGIQVTKLDDGKFKSAGIKEGFIITSVNRKIIYGLEDIKVVLNNVKGGIYIEGVYPNGISAYYAFGI